MKKATITDIAGFLNRTLRVRSIKDSSVNGLQVISRRTGAVRRAGFAVDACRTTFEKADRFNVDLLIVHHGIRWRPRKDPELARQREAFLRKCGIALYAVHLPLDLHEEYGNNMQLCRMLGLEDIRKFGRYHGVRIGYAGRFARTTTPNIIAGTLEATLRTQCRIFPFGRKKINSIGIISGGGGGLVTEAGKTGLDCFLVGEIDLAAYNAAREYGMNVIAAGHYATETTGVRALMPLVKQQFGIETIFIDDPKDL